MYSLDMTMEVKYKNTNTIQNTNTSYIYRKGNGVQMTFYTPLNHT